MLNENDAIRMIAVCKAKPGREEELKAAFLDAVAFSKTEPGCVEYILHVDRERPSDFIFYEVWADQASLDGHNSTSEFKALIDKLDVLLVERAQLIFLQRIA